MKSHLYNKVKSTQHQPTLHGAIDKTKKYDPKSSQAQLLNNAVAYYIAKDMQSLYTVEKPEFRHLIHTLDPKYNLPSRKYFTKQKIPWIYGEIKAVQGDVGGVALSPGQQGDVGGVELSPGQQGDVGGMELSPGQQGDVGGVELSLGQQGDAGGPIAGKKMQDIQDYPSASKEM